MELDSRVLDLLKQATPGDLAIYRVDGTSLKPLFASPGLPGISGLSAEEYARITARNGMDIVLPEDRERVAALLAKGLRERTDMDATYRIIHRTRGFVWVHALGRILGTLNGETIAMIVFQRTSAEAEEHEFLLNHAGVNIFVVDRVTREILYANEPQSGKLLTASAGRTCHLRFGSRDTPCPGCAIPLMKDGLFNCREWRSPALGRQYDVTFRAMNWHGRDAVVVTASDVTDDVRARQVLKVNRDSLAMLVDNTPMGIGVCEIRRDAVVPLAVNERFGELLNVDASRAEAMPPRARIHPDDRSAMHAFMVSMREPGVSASRTFRYDRFNDGHWLWYRLDARSAHKNDSVLAFACLSDVTAEKAAEAERLRSRQIYEAAVESASLICWEYDPSARRIVMADNRASREGQARYGYGKVITNVPESLYPFIDQRSVDDMAAMYSAIRQGAASAACDVWFRMEEGREPHCEHVSYIAARDGAGRITGAWGIAQDVTARKQEEAEYESMSRMMAETIIGAVGSAHLDLTRNRCLGVKSPYPDVVARQTADTADGFLRAVSGDIIDQRIREEFLRRFTSTHLLEVYQTGKKQIAVEYPVRFTGGEKHWLRGEMTLLQNPANGCVEAMTYAQDVTDRKKNEDIIRHVTRERCDYIALVDPVADTIEVRSSTWAPMAAEPGRKSGYSLKIRTMAENFVPAEEREEFLRASSPEELRAALEQNDSCEWGFDVGERGDERKKQLQYSWLNADRWEILLIQTDITAAHRKEQERLRQLREALLQAEKASESKTDFVSRISHDIRTPISIIKSMTAFAQEDVDDRGKILDDLRRIEAANTFLLSLINDVLDISKIDSGKIDLNPEPYPIDEYLSNVRNMFEPLCAQKEQTLRIVGGQTAETILVDHIRLNQITLNLMSNAVKYTPRGGVVTLACGGSPLPGDQVACWIEVKDNGIGMSAAFQQTMFEPFTQEYDNPGRAQAGSGTGLGLAIVRRLVNLLGGTIDVSSRRGAGTDIRVRFTAPAAKPAAADALRTAGSIADEVSLTGRVLLIEDNHINVDIARRMLTSFGLTVDTAENGQEGVRAFSDAPEGTYRLLLMDIQMPIMNGYEATEAIRALDRPDARRIPIVAMTADAFSAALERSREAGMNEYVTKPLDPKLLRALLQRLLAAAEAGAQPGSRA